MLFDAADVSALMEMKVSAETDQLCGTWLEDSQVPHLRMSEEGKYESESRRERWELT